MLDERIPEQIKRQQPGDEDIRVLDVPGKVRWNCEAGTGLV
jgi:hypothetical protein